MGNKKIMFQKHNIKTHVIHINGILKKKRKREKVNNFGITIKMKSRALLNKI